MGFFRKLKGYDDEITQEFSMTLNYQEENNGTIVIRGISIYLNSKIISIVATIPLRVKWVKESIT